jgi:MoaA/NifB/PqqE/SkfB family radical SAM enzyme
MSDKKNNNYAWEPKDGMVFARLYRRVEKAIARYILSLRLFNPWFYTPEGQAFVLRLFLLLKVKNRTGNWSKATRKANTRYYTTQPLCIIPWKRRRFKKKHGFWPPGFIAFSPTTRCNLSCPGCFSGEIPESAEWSFDTADRVIREARAMGIYMYIMIGGEPLCWPHFFKLLEAHPECMFGVYTNGTMITRDTARRLAACGNVSIDFSVEGFEMETDQRRGAGVFSKILDGMQLCREEGVHFGYSVTVTRENNELLVSDEFIEFFLAQGCFDGWYYQYMPVGDSPDAGLIPTPEQRDYRRRRFAEIRDTYPVNIFDFVNDGPLVGGCICGGRYYVHITANGDVEPCAFYPFAVDSIHGKSLGDILKSPFFQEIRSRQTRNTNYHTPCPVIDHPHYLREAVEAGGARSTHASAPLILDQMKEQLDSYGKHYRAIAEHTE